MAWDIEGAVEKGQHSPSVAARRGKEEGKGVGWLSPLVIDAFRATMKSMPDSYGTFVAAVLKFGLDGVQLHGLMIIENRKGGFDMLADMRRRFDTATPPVRIHTGTDPVL